MQLHDAAEKLRQLGLTEYETQAYLVLVQGSRMNAEEIAKNADIPIPRVYGVLESLKTLGLVVILKGRPKKFEIISPEEGLKHLLELRRKAAEETLQHLEQTSQSVRLLLSPIFWRERLRIRPEDLLETLENLGEAETRTREIITESYTTLDIFTDIFSWFETVEKDLIDALNRGVKVRVLMNQVHPTTKQTVARMRSLGFSVRQPQDVRFPVRGTLADSSKVVFLIWASPESRTDPKYVYRPSFSSNEGIVAIFQQSFEYRWQQAN